MRVLALLLTVLLLTQCSYLQNKSDRNIAAAKMVLDKSGYLYDPQDTSCDGFPRVQVETMPGTCLGLVLPRDRALDKATQKGFIKPRTILQVANTKSFIVVDMGGWGPKNGRVFLLTPSAAGPYEIKTLKVDLEMPHGLALGSDGFYYIGERTRISKFHLKNNQITDWTRVIGDIERKEGYMHPLSQFVFDPRNGDLYINSGSPSDHCIVDGKSKYKSCPEEYTQGNGAIYRIPAEHLKNLPPKGLRFFEVAAKGLRNSVAMAISDQGYLIQGENSRDFPELEEPYEEINVIDLDNGRGYHYGWPYCYNFHATSPEWLFPENKSLPIHKQFVKPVDCEIKQPREIGEYQAPWLLMPPHVAPLHMSYYKGKMFADLFGGQLLVTWHGYQPTGQRLVSYAVDEKGRPRLNQKNNSTFGFNQKGTCPTRKSYSPQGGMERHGSHNEIISQWNEIKGIRPKGAPVGLTEASDGSLWIVEDRENRTILRLARSEQANHQDGCEKSGRSFDPRIQLLAWRSAVKESKNLDQLYSQIQKKVITNHCLGCHGNMESDDIANDRFSNLDFIVKNDWISGNDLERSKLYGSIARTEGYTPMPPADKKQFFGTLEGEELNNLLKMWIKNLPNNIEDRYTQVTVTENRNIRNSPSTAGTVCGKVLKGDLIYIDPRPETVVTSNGYKWNKIYMVPSHSRLIKGTCPQPEDGVYYISR